MRNVQLFIAERMAWSWASFSANGFPSELG